MINNPSPINEFIVTNMLPEDGVASIGWPIAIANDLQYLAQEPKHLCSFTGQTSDYTGYHFYGYHYAFMSACTYVYFVRWSGKFTDRDFSVTFYVDSNAVAQWTKDSSPAEERYDPDTGYTERTFTALISSNLFEAPAIKEFKLDILVPTESPVPYIDEIICDVWSAQLVNTTYLTELV